MATIIGGPVTWSLVRDDDGHRTYTITHIVAAAVTDGPSAVLATSGLPQPGDAWTFGGNDLDAYCTFETQIKPHPGHDEGDKTHKWYVTSTFTTKHKDLCPDESIGDPLLVPPKISITSAPRKVEGQYDRNGEKITNSSHEALRGPQNEWDESTIQIRITQNVTPSGKQAISEHIDKVNSETMWTDYPPRTVKFSAAQLERHIYGADCTIYWTRTLTFDIDMRTWDRDIADEGTKCLLGDWVGTEYRLRRIGRILPPDSLSAVAVSGGGTLAADAYTYAVTAIDSLGNETHPVLSVSVLALANSSVQLSWTAVEDAYFYRIYRNNGSGYRYLDEVTMNDLTFTDTGAAGTLQDPPSTNESGRDPDPDNPKDFHRFADRDGNVCRVTLNGAGLPAGARVGTGTTEQGVIHVERYEEVDLVTVFSLPTDLETA